MANKSETIVIRGKTSFAKVLEDQLALNYGKDGREWSFDLVLDKAGEKDAKTFGISEKIKRKDNYVNGAAYIRFKRDEYQKDGETPNKPIEIVDILGRPWDDRRIGNESVVDVKARVVNYGVGKPTGLYVQKIRVLEHVPFEGAAMPELSEDDEYFAKYAEEEAKAAAAKASEDKEFRKDFLNEDDDLDDEIPC